MMRPTVTALVVLSSAGLLIPAARGQQAVAPLVVAAGSALPALTDEDVATLPVTDVWSNAHPPAAAPADHWEQSFAPYIWVPAITGKLTLGAHSARFDGTIGDTINALKDLNAGFLGHYEARYDDAGVMVDVVYLDLHSSSGLPGGATAKTEVAAGITEVGGFQRIATLSENTQDKTATTLEALGGIRNWYVAGNLSVPSAGVHGTVHNDWTDGFVGLRMLSQLDERWALVLRGDIGGFGLFNGSKGTWQAAGTVTYATSPSGQIALGWRQLVIDYSHADSNTRMNLSGPFLGYIFRF
jgi:hypothetical protein